MAQRIVIRVESSAKDKSHYRAARSGLLLVLLLPVLVLTLWNRRLGDWRTAESFIDSMIGNLSKFDSLTIGGFILASLLVAVVSFRMVFAGKNHDKDQEFIVTVYPTGVQVSSSNGGPRGGFIPRDCIVNCEIKEVILAHRVYSSPRLLCQGPNGNKEAVELFPDIELSYSECSDICRKLRKMLAISPCR